VGSACKEHIKGIRIATCVDGRMLSDGDRLGN